MTEYQHDIITGKKRPRMQILNKKKVNKYEMDELFECEEDEKL